MVGAAGVLFYFVLLVWAWLRSWVDVDDWLGGRFSSLDVRSCMALVVWVLEEACLFLGDARLTTSYVTSHAVVLGVPYQFFSAAS